MSNSSTKTRGRIFEWIFRGQTLSAARAGLEQSPSASWRAQAQNGLDVGDRVLELPGLRRDAGHAALAFEAFRRGITAALRAQAAVGSTASTGTEEREEAAPLASLLSSLTPVSITELEHWAELRKSLLEPEYEVFLEQSLALQLSLARSARQLLLALLAPLYIEKRALRRALRQRALRSIGLVLAVILIAVGAVLLIRGRDTRPDLLAGKPWRASSKYAGCQLEEGRCDGQKVKMFFSTDTEKEPWIEYDLKKPTVFSSIRITNRSDCCGERAVPLVVEYSSNQKDWREFARRDDIFSTVDLQGKSTQARYLRLRVDRVSILHLESVKLFP